MAAFDNNLDELEVLLRDLDGRPKSVAPPKRQTSTHSTTLDFDEIDSIINVLGSENQPQQQQRQAPVAQAQYSASPSYSNGSSHANNNSNNPRNTLDNIDDLLRGLDSTNRASVSVRTAPAAQPHQGRGHDSKIINSQRPVTTKMAPSQQVYAAKPPAVRTVQPTVRPVQGDDLTELLHNITKDAAISPSSPAAKGSCGACGRAILGESITALGRIFHPEHFTCGNCQRPLGTSSFFEQDGSPHCEKCYQELLCARCAHCEEPIVDKCITALGKKWHTNHFICTHCLSPFPNGTYFERDSRPYCDSCFSGNFNPRCAGCNQPIKGEITNALGQAWHPEHFVCQFCQKAFNGSFFEYAGKPYCDVHYHQQTGSLCAGCGKAVTGKCINALDKKWHPEHFVCAFCMNPLQGGNYTEANGKAYDKQCHAKLFG